MAKKDMTNDITIIGQNLLKLSFLHNANFVGIGDMHGNGIVVHEQIDRLSGLSCALQFNA